MAKQKSAGKPAVSIPSDKMAAATQAAAQFDQIHGVGSIVRLGAKVGIKHPCISTGIRSLDRYVVQAGGIPRARITEIYGPEAGGKTTLTLHTIASAQRSGDLAGFVDAEHALDPTYASRLGVDVDNLFVSQPDCGEQALEATEMMIRSGAFGIVVVDSVAALVPRAELNGDMGDSHMGLQARLMSQGLRKLTAAVAKSNTALIFINQVRTNIGVMYGSPETTTGGRALKFYASLRLDVRRIATVKNGEVAVANRVKIKAVKNRLGSPFRETEVNLVYGQGFDSVGDVVDEAVTSGIIDKSGAWYSRNGERLGQGRDNVVALLKDNEPLYKEIEAALEAAEDSA